MATALSWLIRIAISTLIEPGEAPLPTSVSPLESPVRKTERLAMSVLARFKIITKILAVIILLAATATVISWLGIHAMASLNTGADNMNFAAQRALEAARANQSVIALNLDEAL